MVQLRLDLQDGSPPISVKGKVAWASKEKAGFAFLDLEPAARAAIEKFLAQAGAAESKAKEEGSPTT